MTDPLRPFRPVDRPGRCRRQGNLTGAWILSGDTRLPVTARGLRSGVVTLIGLDYAFGL